MAAPTQPACQRRTVKARHPHIGQHQVDVVHLELINRLQAVRCLPHGIALVLQEICHHFSDSRLVFNNQDRWRCLGSGAGILRGVVHDQNLLVG